MTEIVFSFPDANTPGYLKRQRAAVALQNELSEGPTVDTVDRLVEFIMQFVKEPSDKKKALEAVWDLPEARFKEVLEKITETQADPKP
jgi:hypothetical protein